MDGFVSDGIDNTPTIRNMVENNDIVAVYNPLGSPAEWSAVLAPSPKQAKIVYIAGVTSEDNLHALIDGEIDAIVSSPCYEAGYIGMEMLDRVLQGETFAEDAWQPALPSYIVTADGAGKTARISILTNTPAPKPCSALHELQWSKSPAEKRGPAKCRGALYDLRC